MEMEAAGASASKRDEIAVFAAMLLDMKEGMAVQRMAKGTASIAAPRRRSNVTLRCACKDMVLDPLHLWGTVEARSQTLL
jgi:hypothetical protein